MMHRKQLLGILLVAAGVAFGSPLYAAVKSNTGKIVQTLVKGDAIFGGCMVKLDKNIGAGCTNWVSFGCSGEPLPYSKDVAYNMFDSAKMAFALGWEVKIWGDNQQLVNGHCLATRIDVMGPPAP